MAGPTDVLVRQPVVAGMFYPADADACRSAAAELLSAEDDGKQIEPGERDLFGAIVPHAGWICSGRIAGEAIATLARSAREKVDAVVIFGAIHTPLAIDVAALDSAKTWRVPGGASEVIDDVRGALRENTDLFATDDRFHRDEHAVEVELPLIELAFKDAAILPVEVGLIDEAEQIGIATAKRVKQLGHRAVFLASSDLTHYGPAYRFAPAGVGIDGLRWAKENDRRLLERIEAFDVEGIVPEVRSRLNACGGGAIAAMLAACREVGATGATVLRHANSYETLADVTPPQTPDNAVGYAGVVVG